MPISNPALRLRRRAPLRHRPRERAGQFTGAYGTVIETFRQCAQKGDSCTINGDGEQTRAFTHVADTVVALVLIGDKGGNEEYGISAQEVFSIKEVARMFNLTITYGPATLSTRSSGSEDTSKLEALGWKQEHTLPEYIQSTK